MKIEDHGIDGFDPLAHTPMEFTVQSAIDYLKSIRNNKVDLPIAVLESLKDSLIKKNKEKNFSEDRRSIVDRNGSILATNVNLYDVGVRPKLLNKKEKNLAMSGHAHNVHVKILDNI